MYIIRMTLLKDEIAQLQCVVISLSFDLNSLSLHFFRSLLLSHEVCLCIWLFVSVCTSASLRRPILTSA